jgi:two-component system, NarL family, sensor kinase
MPKNNDLTYIILFVIIFLIMIMIIITVFIVKSRKKMFDSAMAKKDLEIKLQKDVLQATILSQETERNRIAQDLHDEISSKLVAISLNLHLLKSKKATIDSKAEIIENIITINRNAIENSRKIAHDLLPAILEKFGLHAALTELVLDYNNSKSVVIDYQSQIDFSQSKPETHLQLFRIIQELINNSVKHGKASQINILFETLTNGLQCNYSDNGLGFDSTNQNIKKGLGMRNIESRIEFLNGSYTLEAQINKGIQFQFSFQL